MGGGGDICEDRSTNRRCLHAGTNDAVLEALAKLDNRPALHFREHPFYDAMRAARQAVAPNDTSFVFHSLRHTAASTMANDLQINTILIARLLGHKSLKTTEGYVHVKGAAAAAVAGPAASPSSRRQALCCYRRRSARRVRAQLGRAPQGAAASRAGDRAPGPDPPLGRRRKCVCPAARKEA